MIFAVPLAAGCASIPVVDATSLALSDLTVRSLPMVTSAVFAFGLAYIPFVYYLSESTDRLLPTETSAPVT